MNELQRTTSTVPLPVPRCAAETRLATLNDLPFIDALQKKHGKQVGWMPTLQLQGKIEKGNVLIAEAGSRQLAAGSEEASLLPAAGCPLPAPLGYCIGQDQYFKRDDVGIVYQMNVLPGKQRSLVGATLLKALFERAAYGCRLFCCWCAQDIEANFFWESVGFVPLAFRAGSRAKDRVHIFWQRRIRAGDTTTPYWFPSQTTSGAIREDRLVFPIPPGVRWSDEMPRVLPVPSQGMLEDRTTEKRAKSKSAAAPVPQNPTSRRARFGPPPATPPANAEVVQAQIGKAKTPRAPKPKVKNDPAHIAAARELRDRWLERVNADPRAIESSSGKYDVSKAIESTPAQPVISPRALAA